MASPNTQSNSIRRARALRVVPRGRLGATVVGHNAALKILYPPAPLSAQQWPDHSAQNTIPLQFVDTYSVGAPSWTAPSGTNTGSWNLNLWTTSFPDAPIIAQHWWSGEQQQDLQNPVREIDSTYFSPSFDQPPVCVPVGEKCAPPNQQVMVFFTSPYQADKPGMVSSEKVESLDTVKRARYPTQDFNSVRVTARSSTVYHTGSALSDEGSGHHGQFTPDVNVKATSDTDAELRRKFMAFLKEAKISFTTTSVNHSHDVVVADAVLNDGTKMDPDNNTTEYHIPGENSDPEAVVKTSLRVGPADPNKAQDFTQPAIFMGAYRVGEELQTAPGFPSTSAFDQEVVTCDVTDTLLHGMARLPADTVHANLAESGDRLVLNNIPQSETDIMRLDPSAYQARAAEGSFTPLRLSAPNIELMPTQQQFPLQTLKPTKASTSQSFVFSPVANNSFMWGFSAYRGLNANAKMVIKTVSCWEATADHESIMAHVQRTSPKLDQQAIDKAQEAMAALPHSFPASYNNLGTILKEIAKAIGLDGLLAPLLG